MPVSNVAEYFLPKELKFISSKIYKNGFLWDVVKSRNDFEICPKCGSKSNVRCGNVSVTVREAPIRNNPLWLRNHKTPWPTVLGIDEHFFSRRQGYTEFTTVFCDLKKRLALKMLGKFHAWRRS